MLQLGVLRSLAHLCLLVAVEHVASLSLRSTVGLLGEWGGGVVCMDHGNGALALDRHVRWRLLVVLAEGLAWQLDARLIDHHSCWRMLGRSTVSAMRRITSLVHLLIQPSVELSLASLFVQTVRLISL